MTNLRLLGIERRKSCKKKDSSKRWVVMKDPETGAFDKPHYDFNALSDRFYEVFFRQNNEIVQLAYKNGIDLGKDYDKFMELGVRVSQQLDGKFRELTEQQYLSQVKLVEYALLQKCKDKFETEERRAWGSTIETLLTEDEKPRARTFMPTNPLVLPNRAYGDSITTKVERMKSQAKTDYLQHIPELSPQLRLMFLDVMSLYRRGLDKLNIVRECANDVAAILQVIGNKDGIIYLDLLKENANNRNVYSEFISQMKQDMERLTDEQRGTFFRVLKETRKIDKAFDTMPREVKLSLKSE
jgi:hypothetical protein